MAEIEKYGVVFALVVTACGPGNAGSDGGEDDVGDGVALPDMGDPECPELVWTEGVIQIKTVEEALALPRYTRIESFISVVDVPGLVDLSFLECLAEVNGHLGISSPDLQSLAGLERLEVVSNYGGWPPASLDIWNNPKLESVSALTNLREVGRLTVERNPLLTSLEPLTNLEVADKVLIGSNDSLKTIGLRQLTAVGTIGIGPDYGCGHDEPGAPGLAVNGNASLTEIDGLDALQEFDLLIIAGNPSLLSLNGLLHLADAGGALQTVVEFNAALPYEHILEVQAALGYEFTWVCGNLDEPTECPCIPE